MDKATVHIVHAIDTEGPLYESLDAKFERLKHLLGIDGLPRTAETLARVRAGAVDLGGKEEMARVILNGHLSSYNATWQEIDAMLDRVMARDFRRAEVDSFGGGWVFNWFCLDHVGFINNPRRRDMGFHNIFDHYAERLAADRDCGDALHWHFHPMSTYRDAHACATHYFRSPELFEILSRKIIERGWFPSVFRAGFQAERPDSHWFLEQFIPFDLTNMAVDDPAEFDRTVDFRNGRSGNWRRAPADWSVYHPAHDDYQVPGQCRRIIGRALNVMNRIASIDQREMDKAFAQAASGRAALVGLASHDFRNLETEVNFLRDLVRRSRERYPDVPVRFAEARAAFRAVEWPDRTSCPDFKLDIRLHTAEDDAPSLEIAASGGRIFGPQPFLAIETRSRRFLTDNLDFGSEEGRWYYAFHHDTLPLDDVARIGVAANDKYGNTRVRVLDLRSK